VCLESTAPPALLDSYQIQSVQLSALRNLSFTGRGVSLQPVLQHLSAMTCLRLLHFDGCSMGLAALSGGMPRLVDLVSLTFRACELTVLPPLTRLPCLKELILDENPELRDVQWGLRGVTSLTRLSMRDRTPIGDATLDVVRQQPDFREFDVHACTHDGQWLCNSAEFLARLQRCSAALQFDLIM
jgi:hypothetical protein